MVGCRAAFALVTARVPIKGYEQPLQLRSAHGNSTGGVAYGRRPECRRTVAEPALKDHSFRLSAEGWGVGWRCCVAICQVEGVPAGRFGYASGSDVWFTAGEAVLLQSLGMLSGSLRRVALSGGQSIWNAGANSSVWSGRQPRCCRRKCTRRRACPACSGRLRRHPSPLLRPCAFPNPAPALFKRWK